MQRRTRWFLVVIIILSLGLRFYRLENVPAGLFQDEVDLGYQARSFLETGRDYRGGMSPFYFRSHNADRTPLPVYVTVLSTLIFQSPELQVRGGAALMGVVVVILAFWLVWLWTRDQWAALLAALVFAVSPWQLQFSRIAFEGTTLAMVYLAGLALFFYWLKAKRPWQLVLATVLLSGSVYAYRTMSLFAPLTFVLLGGIFFRDLKKVSIRVLGLCALLVVGLMGTFLYATTIASADETRISQISVFSDPAVPIRVMRAREAVSGDYQDATLGQSPVWWSKVFFNKPVFWFKTLAGNYLTAWSSQFLFISGDPNLRHGVGEFGVLLFSDLLPLLVGLWFLVSQKSKGWARWLGVWLILAPLPSAITANGGIHAHRLFIFSLPLLLVIALGWWRLMVFFKRRYQWVGGVLLASVIWFLGNFLVYYFNLYPYASARSFGAGYKEAVQSLASHSAEYEHLALSEYPDPPVFYYLFWNQIPPKMVQEYGTDFSKYRPDQGQLGKLKTFRPDEIDEQDLVASFQPETLYLVSTREVPLDLRGKDQLPAGLKLVDLIKYPDNEVAFYLIARK